MRICKKCLREIKDYPFCPFCGASQNSNLLTLEQIYSEWSTLYFRKVGRKSREGYENAWRTLRFLGQCAMSDIKISDYQLAMDSLQNKSRSLQNKLLLLIGQLCKYAVAVHRLDVINPSPYAPMKTHLEGYWKYLSLAPQEQDTTGENDYMEIKLLSTDSLRRALGSAPARPHTPPEATRGPRRKLGASRREAAALYPGKFNP